MNRHNRARFCSYQCGRAFTLVELLVAAGLTLVIAGLCLGVLESSLKRWNRSQGFLAAGQEARQILDRLERDLQGAVFRGDGGTWLAASVQPGSGSSGSWVGGSKPIAPSLDPAAPQLAAARFGVGGVWLRLVTANSVLAQDGDGLGVAVAVSYQLIRRGASPSAITSNYIMYRAQCAPRATFDAGYDLSSTSYNTASDERGAPGKLVRPGYTQVIAENVIDFGIRCYRGELDPRTGERTLHVAFPRDRSQLEYRVRSLPDGGIMGSPSPEVIDLFVRVISSEGARQLAALEDGRVLGDWWSIAAAHSWVFTRRVWLQSAPLGI